MTKHPKSPKSQELFLPSPESVCEVVGERIRALRIKNGLSQYRLAYLVGRRSSAFISNIERGERKITVPDLIKVAHYLKVKLSYFYP